VVRLENLVLLPTRDLHLMVRSRLLRDATLLEEAVLDFLLLLDTISAVSTHSFYRRTHSIGELTDRSIRRSNPSSS
jgi:hypothetical protein